MIGNSEFVRESEEALVGAALFDGNVLADAGLAGPYFLDRQLAHIAETILALHSDAEAVTPRTVADSLHEQGLLGKVGGTRALDELQALAARPEERPKLASAVKSAAVDRGYYDVLQAQIRALRGGQRATELVGGAVHDLEDAVSKGVENTYMTAFDGVAAELNRVRDDVLAEQTGIIGLPWGLETTVPTGLPHDKVSVIFGPTGGFKTTIANGIARHVAQMGYKVLKFGLEDSASLEYLRIIADQADVPLEHLARRVFTKSELSRLKRCRADWLKNLLVVEEVVPTPTEMIRTYRSVPGVQVVFSDYLQLIDWEGDSERVAIHNFMLQAQRAAKRDKVAHVVLSQLREDKMDEAEGSKRPRMQWLFGGSAIKNMSKLILGVWQPAKYHAKPSGMGKAGALQYGEWFAQDPGRWDSLVEVVIRKNVLGPTGVAVPLVVDLPTGRIKEFPR